MEAPSSASSIADTTTDASYATPLASPAHGGDKTPKQSFDLNSHNPHEAATPRAKEAAAGETTPVKAGQEKEPANDPIPNDDAHLKAPDATDTETTSVTTTEREKEAAASPEHNHNSEKQLADGSHGQTADIVPPGIVNADPVGATETKSLVGASSAAGDSKPEEKSEDGEDESKYPSGLALVILTVGLFLATFVVALDNTIIATAIPKITVDFDSLGDVGWYGSSYLLTTTSLQPSFGKVYTYFDVKWTYLFALCIFEVGSIICATAPNSVALIIGRAVAGVGASALFSGGMTIIGYSVPLRRRAFYIAILSSTFGIASVVGPLLGGVFTDSAKLTWRFCFWINLPFGGLAILTTLVFFKSPERKHTTLTLREKIGKMDLLGAFFLICGIVCLLLALQWGGTTYPWHDSKVWGCLLGFGLLIIVFIGIQFWRGDDATIPPRLLNQRTVRAGCSFTAFLSMGLYTHIYYLPFYFQAIKGTSAEGSGIRTIPYLVSITLASIVVGGSVTTFGWYAPFLWFGAAIYTVGAGMLYTLQVDDYAGKWIGYQLLAGIGAGSSVQIPFIAVQVVLDAKDMPSGNALTIFFNSLGGALSISIAQNIFSNTLVQQLGMAVPPKVVQAVVGAGATNVRAVTPANLLNAVLEAYDKAVTKAFILPIAVGGISFLCALTIEMKSVKGKKLEMAGGA